MSRFKLKDVFLSDPASSGAMGVPASTIISDMNSRSYYDSPDSSSAFGEMMNTLFATSPTSQDTESDAQSCRSCSSNSKQF